MNTGQTMPVAEQAIRVAGALSDVLNLNTTERLEALKTALKIKAPEYLPLLLKEQPKYPSEQTVLTKRYPAYPAKFLLKSIDSKLTVKSFNVLAEALGYLDSTALYKGVKKNKPYFYKSVSLRGSGYGYNKTSEGATGGTVPVWFEDSFKELLGIIS